MYRYIVQIDCAEIDYINKRVPERITEYDFLNMEDAFCFNGRPKIHEFQTIDAAEAFFNARRPSLKSYDTKLFNRGTALHVEYMELLREDLDEDGNPEDAESIDIAFAEWLQTEY